MSNDVAFGTVIGLGLIALVGLCALWLGLLLGCGGLVSVLGGVIASLISFLLIVAWA